MEKRCPCYELNNSIILPRINTAHTPPTANPAELTEICMPSTEQRGQATEPPLALCFHLSSLYSTSLSWFHFFLSLYFFVYLSDSRSRSRSLSLSLSISLSHLRQYLDAFVSPPEGQAQYAAAAVGHGWRLQLQHQVRAVGLRRGGLSVLLRTHHMQRLQRRRERERERERERNKEIRTESISEEGITCDRF